MTMNHSLIHICYMNAQQKTRKTSPVYIYLFIIFIQFVAFVIPWIQWEAPFQSKVVSPSPSILRIAIREKKKNKKKNKKKQNQKYGFRSVRGLMKLETQIPGSSRGYVILTLYWVFDIVIFGVVMWIQPVWPWTS